MRFHRSAISENTKSAERRFRTLSPIVAAGFVLIAAALIAIMVFGVNSLHAVYDASGAVAHVFEIKAGLHQLLTTFVDAETGQRGFVITGKSEYLEPYDRAVRSVPSDIARVRALVGNDLNQQADLDRLSSLGDVKLRELADAIEKRRTSGMEAARAVVMTNLGKRTMDSIRAVISRMESREDVQLAARTAESVESYREALLTRFLADGIALLITCGLFLGVRKAARDAQRLAEQARLLNLTQDAILVRNPGGGIVYWNCGAEELYGWTAAEAVGQVAPVLLETESSQPLEEIVAAVHRDGRWAGGLSHRRKDGVRVDVASRWSLVRDAEKRPSAVLQINTDITERNRLEAAEKLAKSEAERANRMKDELVAVLSHELRTPLTSILGWATMLTSRELAPDKVQHGLEAMLRSSRAGVKLVELLLDSSRIALGHLGLEMKSVDLASVVTAAVDMVRPAAETKSIGIEVRISASPLVIQGDAARLQQAVWNLLTNSIKFTPGGGKIDVIACLAENRHAEIHVKDNGRGIRADFLPHVFERFSQEKGQRGSQSGLGLGLAIVHDIVQAHGGGIRAYSPGEGQGATFVVTLPLREVLAA